MVSFWAAKIEGNRFLYEETKVMANRWIDTPPYAIQQDVVIQTSAKKVSFGWVGSKVEPKKDGGYQIAGLYGGEGPEHVKRYMIIPFPFEDPAGWNFTEIGVIPDKNGLYIAALEIRGSYRVTHRLDTAYYDTKTHGWMACNLGDCMADVIAWREFPHPKRG